MKYKSSALQKSNLYWFFKLPRYWSRPMVQNHCTYTCITSKLSWATCMFHKMMNEYMCKKKIIIKKSCIFFYLFHIPYKTYHYYTTLTQTTYHWPKLHITDPNFTSLTITTHWLYTPTTNYTPLTLNNSLLTLSTHHWPLTLTTNHLPVTKTTHHWP